MKETKLYKAFMLSKFVLNIKYAFILSKFVLNIIVIIGLFIVGAFILIFGRYM